MVAADPRRSRMAHAGRRAFGDAGAGGEQVLDYDIAPDGQRFLVILEKRSATIAPRLIVVRNWLEELRTRVKPSP